MVKQEYCHVVTKGGYLPLASTKEGDYNNMITMDDIERWDDVLPAKQTLYLLDSCVSGLAGRPTSKNSDAWKRTIEQLAKPSRQLLTAGTSTESTYVIDKKQSSIFTLALLSGLRGAADSGNEMFPKDGVITANELEKHVKKYTAKHLPEGYTTTPQLKELGDEEGENDGEFFFFNVNKKREEKEDLPLEKVAHSEKVTPQSSPQKAILHKRPSKQKKFAFPIPQMVPITKGSFMMGSESGGADETPVHKVTIEDDFEIGKYEVTFEEYDYFCKETSREKPDDEGWGRGKRPVINISWHDATAYVEWLSKKTDQTYRLPTEAEWEYVARAGTTTKWSFGNQIEALKKYANVADSSLNYTWSESWNDGYNYTAPVGKFKPNVLGVYDMYGNVWEWTSSCYTKQYKQKCYKDYKVPRGGSWLDSAGNTRSANRDGDDPSDRSSYIGFRVAKTYP
jgi:formylglycine-generating enzyme required for sulfatase activity